MADTTQINEWGPGVYQYANGDVLDGGPESSETLPIRQLANRSLYQRLRNVTQWDADLADEFGYPAMACVTHAGVTWRSLVANDVAPGTDITKWVRWGFTMGELPNLSAVVDNTYIGPEPQKLRVFTPAVVMTDMPTAGVYYVLQTLVITGARRARIVGHAAFENGHGFNAVGVTASIRVGGVNVFGGHYLGATLPPKTGSEIRTQIPITVSDFMSNLNPANSYTITLVGRKNESIGPVLVQDAYLDVEYV
jgi:hypothetical protein